MKPFYHVKSPANHVATFQLSQITLCTVLTILPLQISCQLCRNIAKLLVICTSFCCNIYNYLPLQISRQSCRNLPIISNNSLHHIKPSYHFRSPANYVAIFQLSQITLCTVEEAHGKMAMQFFILLPLELCRRY